MAKRSLAGARGILTGASSGIGRALAHELARRGAKLVLTARRLTELQSLATELRAAGGAVEIVSGDVTDPAVRQQLLKCARDAFGRLDFVVNNAGRGALGRFDAASPERLRQIMEVNFFAAAELIRESLPLLSAGRAPIIVNVGSILGHRGIPHSSEYCASKFALQGLSESLRAELAPRGIDLLVVSPGTTDTEFFAHAIERTAVPWGEQRGVPSAYVARCCADAMCRGKHEIIVNWRGRLLVLLNRLSPRAADWFLGRYGEAPRNA